MTDEERTLAVFDGLMHGGDYKGAARFAAGRRPPDPSVRDGWLAREKAALKWAAAKAAEGATLEAGVKRDVFLSVVEPRARGGVSALLEAFPDATLLAVQDGAPDGNEPIGRGAA